MWKKQKIQKKKLENLKKKIRKFRKQTLKNLEKKFRKFRKKNQKIQNKNWNFLTKLLETFANLKKVFRKQTKL